jgi:hypothetical protein
MSLLFISDLITKLDVSILSLPNEVPLFFPTWHLIYSPYGWLPVWPTSLIATQGQ